jgi:hypothetical protein
MKSFKLSVVAAALSMAMAAGAGAAGTTTSTTAGASNNTNATVHDANAMKGGLPAECVNLKGQALSTCVRDHNPSSMNSRVVDHPATTSPATAGKAADSDVRRGAMRNDKSGSGSGSTGTPGTAGTTGTSGTGPAGSTAGTTGSAGAGAAGSTGGDTGSSGTGGGNGK